MPFLIFIEDAELSMVVTITLSLIQSTLARASGIAVGQHGAHLATPPVARRRLPLLGHSRAPSAPSANGHKSNKHSRIDSSLDSASSEQTQMAELAKGSHSIKLANIEMKHKKMELAAAERTLVIKQQMQAKQLEYQDRMIQFQVKLARLNGERGSVTGPVSLRQGGHPTNTYRSSTDNGEFSGDTFIFSTGATKFPSLPPTDWGLPEASGSHS